jgi:hypothetical protein
MPPDDTMSETHVAEIDPRRPDVRAPPPPPGKLEAFAVLGGFAGTVPLPWVPDALARRLRGALVQDVAGAHGVVLAWDARQLLADPTGTKAKRGPLGQAFGFLTRKLLVRFGPLALLPPLRSALETYVLGYLFDRYLARGPREDRMRVEPEEARLVRRAIEQAVLRVVSPERGLDWPVTPLPREESRDEITQALDSLLSATTTIPSWLLGRLATAFDEAIAELR